MKSLHVGWTTCKKGYDWWWHNFTGVDVTTGEERAFYVGYGANAFFRLLNAFEMFWHADKNWGKDYTSPWVWFSSCNLKSRISGRVLKNSVLVPRFSFTAMKQKQK